MHHVGYLPTWSPGEPMTPLVPCNKIFSQVTAVNWQDIILYHRAKSNNQAAVYNLVNNTYVRSSYKPLHT